MRRARGRKVVQLAVVAPAQPGPGRGHLLEEKKGHDGPSFIEQERSEKRIRAIAERAPEAIRDLYRQDLIGVDVAARLGPKSPTPEQFATVIDLVAVRKERDAEERKRVLRYRRMNIARLRRLERHAEVTARLARETRAELEKRDPERGTLEGVRRWGAVYWVKLLADLEAGPIYRPINRTEKKEK